jgi:hypothetical protein
MMWKGRDRRPFNNNGSHDNDSGQYAIDTSAAFQTALWMDAYTMTTARNCREHCWLMHTDSHPDLIAVSVKAGNGQVENNGIPTRLSLLSRRSRVSDA